MPILNMIAQGSGGGGGGSNVGEPTNLSAFATSNTSIDIKWTDNNLQAIPPSTFQKSVLVRKVGSAPTTPSDGTTVVTETVMNTYQSSAYSDTGLTQGTTYYYQVFSYSADGGITYGTPVSATPSGGWYPGANTIAYYPLDSVNQLADLSGNSNTLIKDGTVTFTDNYASFLADGRLDTPINSTPTNQTVIFWIMPLAGGGNEQTFVAKWGTSLDNYRWGIIKYNGNLNVQINNSWSNVVALTDNTWYMVVQTTEGAGTTNCNFKVYINGNTTPLINQTAPLYNDSNTYIRMGGRPGNRNLVGRLSGVIIEDKVRTAQEVADYYDSIKVNYGIS